MSASNVGDPGSIPVSGRSLGEGNGNPLQYSCLENPMDGEAWEVTVHGVAKSQTRLSNFTFTFNMYHKSYHFKHFKFLNVESNSRVFSSFEIKPLYLLNSTSPSFPSPQSLTTTILFSISMYLTTLSISCSWNPIVFIFL